jgi:general secretion pathway protein H
MKSTKLFQGFTLLELMLVIGLMGLAVSYVILNIVGANHEQELEKQAKRFQVIVDMAADVAVLNQIQLGIRIDRKENRYVFMQFNEDENWEELAEHELFEVHGLPEIFSLAVQLDDLPWIDEDSLFSDQLFDEELMVSDAQVSIGKEENKPPKPPQIWILPSGEITPFSVHFSYEPEFETEDPVHFTVSAVDDTPLDLVGPLESL